MWPTKPDEKSLWCYRADVTRVIDADTLEIVIDHGMHIYTVQRVRLFGVDAWEVRGEEREKGLEAKEAVIDLIATLGKTVYVQTEKDKKGSFGRYLAYIWIGDILLNQWLIEHGYGTLDS